MLYLNHIQVHGIQMSAEVTCVLCRSEKSENTHIHSLPVLLQSPKQYSLVTYIPYWSVPVGVLVSQHSCLYQAPLTWGVECIAQTIADFKDFKGLNKGLDLALWVFFLACFHPSSLPSGQLLSVFSIASLR